MRTISIICILLASSLILLACQPQSPEPSALSPTALVESTATATLSPSPTLTQTSTLTPSRVPPTSTSTPTSTATLTPTLTPPSTMEPTQAEEMIRRFLKEPVDCTAPCFWGITPGQTTLGEATNILAELGIALEPVYPGFNKFYWAEYELGDGLSVGLSLTGQDGVVDNMEIYLDPEKQRTGVEREWQAFSPDGLIRRYGIPSLVGFFVCRGAPNLCYLMEFYYDELDMIIEYSGQRGNYLTLCPLKDQYDGVKVWLGPNPDHSPTNGTLVDKATTMTIEEFAELMTGDPGKACFRLIDENMP